MSEKVNEPKHFWILKENVKNGDAVVDDPPDFIELFYHAINKTDYDRLAEINKVLVEALERSQKILQAYSDVKVESPGSSPNEEYLAFKGYGMNKEVLEKAKEMGNE